MYKYLLLLFFILTQSKSIHAQLPLNDNCLNAISLIIDGPTVNGNTDNATGDFTLSCGGIIDDDIWYQFVATTASARIIIKPDTSGIYNPTVNTTFEVFSGTCSGLVFNNCYNAPWSSVTNRELELNVGATYYIKVYSTYPKYSDRGKFKINLTTMNVVTNKICNSATTLIPTPDSSLNYVNGSTNGRSNEGSCYFSDYNVWYKFTVTSRFNRIKIIQDSLPSNIFTTVYSYNCATSYPTVRICNTDSVISLNDFLVGEQIGIRLNSKRSTFEHNNNFKIAVYTDSLRNDDCINAITLNIENDANKPAKFFTTLDATQSLPSCDAQIVSKDVWFKFIAGNSPIEIVIDNMTGNIESQLFSGGCNSLTSLICQNKDNILLPQNLTAGATYYVRVYSASSTLPVQFFIKAYLSPIFSQNSLTDTSCIFQNLVNNPGFENFTNCPTNFTYNVTPGNDLIPGWIFPSFGSTDYYNSCSNFDANIHVPRNFCSGKQLPRSGKGFAGFFTFLDGSDEREYLGGSLMSPMIPGKKYLISYWINLSDYSEFGHNKLGVYFTTSPYTINTFKNIPVIPHIISPFLQFFTDKEKWVNVSSFFYPTQAYTNFTIGNFSDDTSTITTHTSYSKDGGFGGSCDVYNSSYINIDDVTIAEVMDSVFCNSIIPLTLLDFKALKNSDKSVSLFWKTTNEINVREFEIERSSKGNNFFKISKKDPRNLNTSGINDYESKDLLPIVGPNYYRLKIIDNDNTYKYSKIQLIQIAENFKISILPNPFQNSLTVNCEALNCKYLFYDSQGKLIKNGDLHRGQNYINTFNLSKGLFLLKIISFDKIMKTEKIIKN